MNKLFESQWQRTKEALCEGRDLTHNQDGTLNHNKKQAMATVLENTKRHLMEAATAGGTNASSVATLNKVILPVIRRVMPTVIANLRLAGLTLPIAQAIQAIAALSVAILVSGCFRRNAEAEYQ